MISIEYEVLENGAVKITGSSGIKGSGEKSAELGPQFYDKLIRGLYIDRFTWSSFSIRKGHACLLEISEGDIISYGDFKNLLKLAKKAEKRYSKLFRKSRNGMVAAGKYEAAISSGGHAYIQRLSE